MASVDRTPVPALPPSAHALLADLEPESGVLLQRRGGKTYETIHELVASPLEGATPRKAAELVELSVRKDGEGYFALIADDRPRVTWYAYVEPAGSSLASALTDEQRAARMWEDIARYSAKEHKELLTSLNLLAGSLPKLFKSIRKEHSSAMKQLRQAAETTSETTIAALKTDATTERMKLGKDVLENFLANSATEDKTIVGILANVGGLLTPDDYRSLRAHELGKELWSVKSPTALRECAAKIQAAILSGELTLSPESLRHLGPYVAKLTQTEQTKAAAPEEGAAADDVEGAS